MFCFRHKERIKFLLQAKNAHGLHSPYVFGFYNEVKKQAQSLKLLPKKIKGFNAKQSRIILTIIQYLKPNSVLVLSDNENFLIDWRINFSIDRKVFSTKKLGELPNNTGRFDMIVISKPPLNTEKALLKKLLPLISNESIVIIPHIHASKEAVIQWKSLIKENTICVSIDLFFVGLLFFRKESTKQDFLLRF